MTAPRKLTFPTVGQIIDLAGEKWVYWLNAILLGILFLLVLLCLPETLYPRHLMLHQLPMICEGTG